MALLMIKDCDVLYLKPSEQTGHPWAVVCHDPSAPTDKYVVWYVDEDGDTIVGGYHPTVQEALDDFHSRS